MSRTERQARRYVQAREKADLQGLEEAEDRAHQRAEGCGCLQCNKLYQKAMQEYDEEWSRINVKGEDQDEAFVMNFALRRLEEESNK